MVNTLITTLINRPYVVAFLLAYLFIAIKTVNLRFTIFYLICGYLIAFISEFCSIHYGVPYGWYFYNYENLAGEWLNSGVPVWDSVSYVFMCFAGLSTAMFVLRRGEVASPATFGRGNPAPTKIVLLSAVFTTLLDVIVDPVAHRGAQWFLGDIYYYPNPGFYFDVTLANFAGWLLVSFCINAVGVFVLGFDKEYAWTRVAAVLGLGLYFGIFGFGMMIAVGIGAWGIFAADLVWLGLVGFILYKRRLVCF